jgi:hypothetical protein
MVAFRVPSFAGFVVTGVAASSGLPGTTMPPDRHVITGTWGVPSPPTILSAVARDGGGECGLSLGDTLTLVSSRPWLDTSLIRLLHVVLLALKGFLLLSLPTTRTLADL